MVEEKPTEVKPTIQEMEPERLFVKEEEGQRYLRSRSRSVTRDSKENVPATREKIELREPRETRENREIREKREPREVRDIREKRETRDGRDIREYRENREIR
jgi:ribonuclease E